MDIAKRIVELRTKKGLSQYALWKKAGISQGSLSQYEAGLKTPGVDVIGRICDALDISMADFFNEVDGVSTDFLPKENSEIPDEVWELRDRLHKRPEMKMLFNASKNVKKEDIETVAKLMESFKKDEWTE